jgi:hypothetical protein
MKTAKEKNRERTRQYRERLKKKEKNEPTKQEPDELKTQTEQKKEQELNSVDDTDKDVERKKTVHDEIENVIRDTQNCSNCCVYNKLGEEERKIIEESDINQLKELVAKTIEENHNLQLNVTLLTQRLEDMRRSVEIRFIGVVGMFDKLQLEIKQTSAIEHEQSTIALKNEEADEITDDSDSDEYEICKRTPITEEQERTEEKQTNLEI